MIETILLGVGLLILGYYAGKFVGGAEHTGKRLIRVPVRTATPRYRRR